MKIVFLILLFFTCGSSCSKNETEMMEAPSSQKKYTYLALGDSYTIGELVPPEENFPNQVIRMMKNQDIHVETARIIAKTGWTTDELEAGIIASNENEPLLSSYDFVTLLIGVNNQYRGRSVDNYKPEFEKLLRKAIH